MVWETRILDLGHWVWNLKALGLKVREQASDIRVWVVGSRVYGFGLMIWGLGFGLEGSGFRVQGVKSGGLDFRE